MSFEEGELENEGWLHLLSDILSNPYCCADGELEEQENMSWKCLKNKNMSHFEAELTL